MNKSPGIFTFVEDVSISSSNALPRKLADNQVADEISRLTAETARMKAAIAARPRKLTDNKKLAAQSQLSKSSDAQMRIDQELAAQKNAVIVLRQMGVFKNA